MKKINLLLTILTFCLLPSLSFAGSAFYVDSSRTDTAENGSFAHPWNSVDDVNRHTFSTGDDVYFKVGTSYAPTASLYINWNGSAADRATIGAYYGEGQFGLGSGARPVFDGKFAYPGGESGLIRYWKGTGYLTIQDLQVQNVNGYGIEINFGYDSKGACSVQNTIQNCYVKNTTYQGIVLARSSYSYIVGNIVERASYNTAPMAGIEVTGGNDSSEKVALYNTVSGNVVYWCYEGIGSYGGARYTTVENNIVYDNRSYHVYAANSRDVVFRYNIVYETPNQLSGDGRDLLIGTDCEGHIAGFIKVTGSADIYGNYVAGGSIGIGLMSNSNDLGVYQTNNKIHDNIIVDCDANFGFERMVAACTGNEITNNISYTLTTGTVHANNFSPYGVIWSKNNFDDSVSGNAATGAYIGVVLSKQSGWRTLSAGGVDESFFNLTSVGQTALNSVFSGGTSSIAPPTGLTIKE